MRCVEVWNFYTSHLWNRKELSKIILKSRINIESRQQDYRKVGYLIDMIKRTKPHKGFAFVGTSMADEMLDKLSVFDAFLGLSG